MLFNVCKDIENLKKQCKKYGYEETDNNIQYEYNRKLNDFKEYEQNIDNLNEILKSIEEINNDVVTNKNLLKSILKEDHEVKKKYIVKIKNIINSYVNFYDYVDGIRQSLEKPNLKTNISMLKLVNLILSFLEKEYSNIGLIVNTPKIGVDKFDNSKHEIILKGKELKLPNETILAVIKRGFYYNDRNIRYVRKAKVIILSN